MNIHETIEQCLRQIMTWQPEKISFADYLVDDLGLDSIDYYDLAEALETAFEINIFEEDMASWDNVGDVYNTVQMRLQND